MLMMYKHESEICFLLEHTPINWNRENFYLWTLNPNYLKYLPEIDYLKQA
jgi:hypothetical protein